MPPIIGFLRRSQKVGDAQNDESPATLGQAELSLGLYRGEGSENLPGVEDPSSSGLGIDCSDRRNLVNALPAVRRAGR